MLDFWTHLDCLCSQGTSTPSYTFFTSPADRLVWISDECSLFLHSGTESHHSFWDGIKAWRKSSFKKRKKKSCFQHWKPVLWSGGSSHFLLQAVLYHASFSGSSKKHLAWHFLDLLTCIVLDQNWNPEKGKSCFAPVHLIQHLLGRSPGKAWCGFPQRRTRGPHLRLGGLSNGPTYSCEVGLDDPELAG